MEKQILNGLTITYDISEEEKINEISKFIQNHQFMFDDFDNGNNNETININEFKNLVNQIIVAFTKEKSLKTTIESEEFLPSMYLSYLILKKGQLNNTLIQLPSNMTIELVLFILSFKYYNYDIEKISQALLSNTSNEYKEMINQLKNEQRMNTYNYYLKCASSFLEEYDTSMLDNLESIIEKLTQKYTDYMSYLSSNNSKLENLKELSNDEFDKLFIDFLGYINAPKKWFEFYIKMRKNNLISFEYSKEIENGECYFDGTDNNWKIKLISDGTIRTFVTFAHEFMHYVSLSQSDNINFSLLEFPSIYYENIASEFLKNNGYEEGIIDETLNMRNSNSFSLFGSQILQLKDILSFKKNGPVSLERRIDFCRNWIKSMNEFKINMAEIFKNAGQEVPDYLLVLEERNPVEIAYDEIDAEIDALVESGLLILNGYQYLVGSLLAFNILDKVDKECSNNIMIDVTNQLGNHSINSITQLFGINLSNEQSNENVNGLQKKLTQNSKNNN